MSIGQQVVSTFLISADTCSIKLFLGHSDLAVVQIGYGIISFLTRPNNELDTISKIRGDGYAGQIPGNTVCLVIGSTRYIFGPLDFYVILSVFLIDTVSTGILTCRYLSCSNCHVTLAWLVGIVAACCSLKLVYLEVLISAGLAGNSRADRGQSRHTIVYRYIAGKEIIKNGLCDSCKFCIERIGICTIYGLYTAGIVYYTDEVIITCIATAEHAVKLYLAKRGNSLSTGSCRSDLITISVNSICTTAVSFTISNKDNVCIIAVPCIQDRKCVIQRRFPVGSVCSSRPCIRIALNIRVKCCTIWIPIRSATSYMGSSSSIPTMEIIDIPSYPVIV